MNNNFFPSNSFTDMNLDNNILPGNDDLNNYNNQTSWFNNNQEEKYIENILKINLGKKAKVYITIPGSKDTQDKIFEGIIEQVGKDHIVVSNPTTGEWSLLLIPYITFISFDEKINY